MAAGADKPTALAVESGLVWPVRHQSEDGRWDADASATERAEGETDVGRGLAVHDIGVTGLARLALLGDGNTLNCGPHHANVQHAIEWLRQQQDQATGSIGTASHHTFLYDHAIASLAMVEAYGLSQDAMMRNNAQRAIDNLESHCNPHCAARDFKLDVNLEALEKAADWLEGMTDPVSGRTGYSERGGYSSRSPGRHGTLYPREANEAMTAASLLCRFFLGQQSDENPILRRQAELVASKPPVWEAGKVDEYAWYLGTNAMYQFGGPHWKMWSRGLDDAVVKTQRQNGDFLGSWDPVGVWGQIGGRVFSTAMLTLTLQSYYRSSRLVR